MQPAVVEALHGHGQVRGRDVVRIGLRDGARVWTVDDWLTASEFRKMLKNGAIQKLDDGRYQWKAPGIDREVP